MADLSLRPSITNICQIGNTYETFTPRNFALSRSDGKNHKDIGSKFYFNTLNSICYSFLSCIRVFSAIQVNFTTIISFKLIGLLKKIEQVVSWLANVCVYFLNNVSSEEVT